MPDGAAGRSYRMKSLDKALNSSGTGKNSD